MSTGPGLPLAQERAPAGRQLEASPPPAEEAAEEARAGDAGPEPVPRRPVWAVSTPSPLASSARAGAEAGRLGARSGVGGLRTVTLGLDQR